MKFTHDAFAALTSEGLSRRRFLKVGGALIVGFSAASVAGRFGLDSDAAFAQGTRAADAQVDAWLAIAADGGVTAYTGKCELGQGIFTAQLALVAEELSVPVARVRLVQCDTSITPDQGTTSGSQSTPTNFNDRNLALAAATARELLLQRASARLGVPVDQLAASDGVVTARGDRSKTVSYGALLQGQKFSVPHGRKTDYGQNAGKRDTDSDGL